MQHYMDANNAVESMNSTNIDGSKGSHGGKFEISHGLAGDLFVLGTKGIG